MDIKTIATDLFNVHPDADVLYFTSDGQAFLDFKYAEYQIERLKDKAIKEIYRDAAAKQRVMERLEIEKKENEIGIEEAFIRACPELAACIKNNRLLKR
ncbi:MAG: hypothetical protein M3O71_02525 [Bacteroidota bacterium]|nr:hypothetical protein [Bacteroidota bacterium]